MKTKIEILVSGLVLFAFILTSNFAIAQDPNDPGVPDTVWLSIVPMSETWDPFRLRPFPFAVECSAFIDEYLTGINVPISFYHSQNLDIMADSIKFSTWFKTRYPGVIGSLFHDDSVGSPQYTAKSLIGGGLWFHTDTNKCFPPGRGVLFKVYFNTDYTQVPGWDTTKSIVLDSLIFITPSGDPFNPTKTRLDFTDTIPVTFTPLFRYGVIGETVVISGTVYDSVTGDPDSGVTVYCKGKDVNRDTFDFPGREIVDLTDSSGNFRFVVGKGGYWCVFRDTTGGLDPNPGGNAYCFDSLVSDTSGLLFNGHTDVEEEKREEDSVPDNFVLFPNYPNPFNPNTLIRFALPVDCDVKLEVYNILGQKVRTLADGFFPRGVREVVWDGKNLKGEEVSSGIYFYRIQSKNYAEVKKMVILR